MSNEMPEAAGEAAQVVAAARELWVKRLIDPSRANTLLFFRDLKVGSLDLAGREAAVTRLVEGGDVNVGQLELPRSEPNETASDAATEAASGAATDAAGRPASARAKLRHTLQTLRQKAVSNLEEKGVDTLHLALGMAGWPALDGGKPYQSPVLLVPLRIAPRGQAGLDLVLQPAGEPKINPVLLHVLSQDYAIELDDDALLRACSDEDEDGVWRVQPSRLFDALREAAAKSIASFAIEPRAVIANFHFARMAMVEDLQRNEPALGSSRLAVALAGHAPTRATFASRALDSQLAQLDTRDPDAEHYVLDADPTQQAAIEAVERGEDLVVQGPPGTGKSQTIANLIAQSVAAGRRVLFVAEKRAALEAVIKRLSDPSVGLGHLVLDLHGASISRKAVMAKLRETLETVKSSPRPEGVERVHREFEARRDALNAHAQRVNRPRAPLELSVVQLIGRLLALPPHARSKARAPADAFAKLTREKLERAEAAVRAFANQPRVHLGSDELPWSRAQIADGAAAQSALALARRAADELSPALGEPLARVAADCECRAPASLNEIEHLLAVLRDAATFGARYRPQLFEQDLEALSDALEPAATGAFGRLSAFLFDSRFRAARKTMLAARTSPVSSDALHREAIEALKLQRRWREHAPRSNAPAHSAAASSLGAASTALAGACEALRRSLPGLAGPDRPLEQLGEQLAALASDNFTVFQMPEVLAARAALHDAGLARLVDEWRVERVDPESFRERFDFVLFSTALEHALANEPKLASFRGREHEQLVEEFRQLDRERIRLAAARVRRVHAERVIATMNAHPEQADLVKREVAKKARHRPLRQLFEEAPDVLTCLAPCWVASPLSVSQLLAARPAHFDLVVFDEASQVLPEEAVPALYRAKQVVAAGDRHQLPPTTFFATAIEQGDVEQAEQESASSPARLARDATGGFESLLDNLGSFVTSRMLEWHYRSHDERLITFSNVEVYDKRLITFPSARRTEAIRHVLVESEASLSGQEDSSQAEVEKVVELVLEHARTRPGESLGVITMGIQHAARVQAALDRAVAQAAQESPELAEFFALERDDRFFVKNLETVQGDERDAIVLSIGYGRSPSGSLPLNRFGPLLQQAGYRRLNVAITRARKRMCVVSSFRADEIDSVRSSSRGLAMLKAYMNFASNGGERLASTEAAAPAPSNSFEADVRAALEARGLELRAQFGALRLRIDLVAMHPERPGEPVLAIECDGEAYHSSATARDRDRLRQAQLERLGWSFHRVWSSDWFRDRDAEIERACAAFERAVQRANGQSEPAPDAVVADLAPVVPASAAPAPPSEPARRPPRPKVPAYKTIERYTDAELLAIVAWVAADGVLRTDDEFIRLAAAELPFERLGSKIRERLAATVESWRASAT